MKWEKNTVNLSITHMTSTNLHNTEFCRISRAMQRLSSHWNTVFDSRYKFFSSPDFLIRLLKIRTVLLIRISPSMIFRLEPWITLQETLHTCPYCFRKYCRYRENSITYLQLVITSSHRATPDQSPPFWSCRKNVIVPVTPLYSKYLGFQIWFGDSLH